MFFGVFLFFMGSILSIPIFLLILVALSYFSSRKAPRRATPVDSPVICRKNSNTVQWMNKILAKFYTCLINESIFVRELSSFIDRIPNENTYIDLMSLNGFRISEFPPCIDSVLMNQPSIQDSIIFHFHYQPELSVDMYSTIMIPYIKRSIDIDVNGMLHGLTGSVLVSIKMNEGPILIEVMKNTAILVDIDANLASVVNISSDLLGSVWSQLISWIQKKIHSIVVQISLEDLVFNQRPQTKRKSFITINTKIFTRSLLT